MTGVASRLAGLASDAGRIRDEAAARHPALAGPPPAEVVAVGLGTVDLERAASERAASELGIGEWSPLGRDPLLGAVVLRWRPQSVGGQAGLTILLLEPDTEGPLAAALARFGEGLAAVYVRPAGPTRIGGRFARTGPLGGARLVPGPRWGPYVVVLEAVATEPAATIDP